MSDLPISDLTVDLTRLPAPAFVVSQSFEEIRDARLTDLQQRWPAFDALVESDPAIKLIEAGAYREVLTREAVNDAGRATLLAHATGADLVFVTAAEVAAHRKDAEKAYDDDLAAIAAADADRQAREQDADRRHAELLALDPPAIVVVDGLAWERRGDGSYAPLDDAEDGFLQSWHALLANFDVDDVNATYADRAAFDTDMAAASAGAEA